MAAMMIGEEFAIPQDEAKMIAEPLAAVAAMYPNSVISPKVLAWTALGGAVAVVHGPRFAARMLRAKMEREEKMRERANAPRSQPTLRQVSPVPEVSHPQPPAPIPRGGVMMDPSFVSFTPERGTF